MHALRRIATALGGVALALGFSLAAAPSASADINGKYLETYHYTCQSSGIYHDAYGPTTGYRAYGSYCHSKTSFHSGYIRLVTSCSWGFTYYSDWVWVDPASSGVNVVSPKESEMGCTWGVSTAWLEER